MKLLIVAHPDDEVIWFDPSRYDRLIILFGAQHNAPWFSAARSQAIQTHPLRSRITFFDLPESGYWENSDLLTLHQENFSKVTRLLADAVRPDTVESIFTHNANGEYGHTDHILVHDVVKMLFHYQQGIPVWTLAQQDAQRERVDTYVEPANHALFDQIKKNYEKYRVWTFPTDYILPKEHCYHRCK